jgi:hypothetical protein
MSRTNCLTVRRLRKTGVADRNGLAKPLPGKKMSGNHSNFTMGKNPTGKSWLNEQKSEKAARNAAGRHEQYLPTNAGGGLR